MKQITDDGGRTRGTAKDSGSNRTTTLKRQSIINQRLEIKVAKDLSGEIYDIHVDIT
jgi:hypothetical protein